MAWFGDQLYLGITRANLAMLKVHNPPELHVWPVRPPADLYDLDMRAQIWRYHPPTGVWHRVFQSPLVTSRIPRDIGYRGMVVFQAPTDRVPALYICTWSPSRAKLPPIIMRSENGADFHALPSLSDDPTLNTYRILASYCDMLVTSPTGRVHGNQNTSNSAIVLANPDPCRQPWRPVSSLGFGDPNNLTVFEMTEFAGWLYAGTLNPLEGYQIWKGRVDSARPEWRQIIHSGAYRGPTNECALSMCPMGDALYVGSGIQNGGYDRSFNVGPAAAEIIRIYPDDSWDLLVGQPRMTPNGFKRPLSGMSPGFDEFFNGYIWRLAVHDGWLYAGTYKWGTFLPYLPLNRWSQLLRARITWQGVEPLARAHGGFDLWRTRNGVDWIPVTLDGFGNIYNVGARTLVPSPYGVFVGTGNPFGPEIATRATDGWHYHPNHKGGLEVWQGQPLIASRELRSVTATPSVTLLPRYDSEMLDPIASEFYECSGFYNFGYWRPGIHSARQACEALVDELVTGVEPRGRLLDVACGRGGTAAYLSRRFSPSSIIGIDISSRLLQLCRETAPGCQFLQMDATALDFPAGHFNIVISLEAAFHFDTRDIFLSEAWRVLVPGGYLLLSDILFRNKPRIRSATPHLRANLVTGLADYESRCVEVGFSEVCIRDATETCVGGFVQHLLEFLRQKMLTGAVAPFEFAARARRLKLMSRSISHYILVSARKPAAMLRRV